MHIKMPGCSTNCSYSDEVADFIAPIMTKSGKRVVEDLLSIIFSNFNSKIAPIDLCITHGNSNRYSRGINFALSLPSSILPTFGEGGNPAIKKTLVLTPLDFRLRENDGAVRYICCFIHPNVMGVKITLTEIYFGGVYDLSGSSQFVQISSHCPSMAALSGRPNNCLVPDTHRPTHHSRFAAVSPSQPQV